MKSKRFQIGPGAASLVLIIVLLVLSALSVLSLLNARNDLLLSRRALEVAEIVYGLETKAEESLARLDAILLETKRDAAGEEEYLAALTEALPEKYALENGVVSWVESDGESRELLCEALVLPYGEGKRAAWLGRSLATELQGSEEEDAFWN